MKTKPSLGPLGSPKPHFNPVVPTPAALEPAAEKPPAPAAEPMKLTSGQVILLHLISRHDGTYLAQRAYRSIQQLLELKLIEDNGDESSNTVQHFRARITDAGRQALIDADKAVGAPVPGAQAVQPVQEAPTDLLVALAKSTVIAASLTQKDLDSLEQAAKEALEVDPTPEQPVSITEAFGGLADLTSEHFRDVDAEQFVAGLRGEDDPPLPVNNPDETDQPSDPGLPALDPTKAPCWAPEDRAAFVLSYPADQIPNFISEMTSAQLQLALNMEREGKSRKTVIALLERAVGKLTEGDPEAATDPVVYHVGDYVRWHNDRIHTRIGIVRQLSEDGSGLFQVEGWSTSGDEHDMFMLEPGTVRPPTDNEYEWIWTYSTRRSPDELLFVEWKDHFITFDWNRELNGRRYNWHPSEKWDLGLAARVSKRYADHCLEIGKAQIFKLDDLDDRMKGIVGKAGRARGGKILDLEPDKLPAGEDLKETPALEQAATEPFVLALTQSNFEFLAQRSAMLEKRVAKLNRQRARVLKNAYWDRFAAVGSRNVASLLQKDIKEQAQQIEEMKAQIVGQAEKMAAQQATIDALCAENAEMRAAALGIPVADLLDQIDEPEIVPTIDGDNAQSGVSTQAEVPPHSIPSGDPISSVTV